jgi:hypothetical protein
MCCPVFGQYCCSDKTFLTLNLSTKNSKPRGQGREKEFSSWEQNLQPHPNAQSGDKNVLQTNGVFLC